MPNGERVYRALPFLVVGAITASTAALIAAIRADLPEETGPVSRR